MDDRETSESISGNSISEDDASDTGKQSTGEQDMNEPAVEGGRKMTGNVGADMGESVSKNSVSDDRGKKDSP